MRSNEHDELVLAATAVKVPAFCKHCQRPGTVEIVRRTDRIFRPERLVIASERGQALLVEQLFIGCEAQFSLPKGTLVLGLFAPEAVDMGLTFSTVAVGVDVTLVLKNVTDEDLFVERVSMFGPSVDVADETQN
jgi:hypothetical protein